MIGGCNDKGALRTVEQYHMEKERWTHVRKLDKAIQNHAAAAHGHMVRTVFTTQWVKMDVPFDFGFDDQGRQQLQNSI